MLPGPVFDAELLTLARRKRYYAIRFLYGLLLLYLVWQYRPSALWELSPSPDGELTRQELVLLGQTLFGTFALTQALFVLLVTPTLVAGVVADERQRKTLHDLLASRLTSAEIVLGKLAARLLVVAAFLGIGLPVFVILSLFGGVDPGWVLFFFAGCASTAFFLGSVAVAVSVQARRPREAVTTTYLLEAVWLFGPSLVSVILPAAGGVWYEVYDRVRPGVEWLGASSPFYVFQTGILRGLGSPSLLYPALVWMIGLQLLYGAALAAIAVVRLRPVSRSEGATRSRLVRALSGRARRFLPRPGCGDDALLWKERYVSRTGPLTKAVAVVLFLMVAGLLGHATYQFAEPAFQELRRNGYSGAADSNSQRQLNWYLRVLVTIISCSWLIGTAAASSGGLTSEREEDTWVSLIATPLTPAEIVRAKMFGAVYGVRWIGLLGLLLLSTGLILGAVHPIGFVAEVVLTAVYLWFACALGTVFSLRSSNSGRALTGTMVSLMICNGVYLLLFLPFPVESSFRFLGMAPFALAASMVSYVDLRPAMDGVQAMGRLDRRWDYLVTVLASLAVYVAASSALTAYLVLNFDDAIDRPRTHGGREPKGVGRPASTDEIEEPAAD